MDASRGDSPQAGDDPARIVEFYWPLVRRVCRAHARSDQDAEDAAQETFLQFLEADRARISNLDAWFATVAHHVCAKIHRRRYRAVDVLRRIDPPPDPVDPGDIALDTAWFDGLAEHLRPSDHRVLRLLYVQQLTLDQVAALLGVTNGNVRVIAHRARRHAGPVVASLQERRT